MLRNIWECQLSQLCMAVGGESLVLCSSANLTRGVADSSNKDYGQLVALLSAVKTLEIQLGVQSSAAMEPHSGLVSKSGSCTRNREMIA